MKNIKIESDRIKAKNILKILTVQNTYINIFFETKKSIDPISFYKSKVIALVFSKCRNGTGNIDINPVISSNGCFEILDEREDYYETCSEEGISYEKE